MYKSLFIFVIIALVFSCKSVQKCEEHLNPACICTEQYEPVCGCNGKTYGNACMAQCAGITQFTQGECPNKNSSPKLTGTSWNLQTFAKMFCDMAMKWETMYFSMLEKSRFYRMEGDTLEIDCGDMGVLVLKKG